MGNNSKVIYLGQAAEEDAGDLDLSKWLHYHYRPDVVLIGRAGVGKSSLLTRYVDDCFEDRYVPNRIGHITFKFEDVNGIRLYQRLLYTPGQGQYNNWLPQYYRRANAVLVVFDVNNADSFKDLESWVTPVRQYCPEGCVFFLIGNKVDAGIHDPDNQNNTSEEAVTRSEEWSNADERTAPRSPEQVMRKEAASKSQRQVEYATAKALADRLDMSYVETDARTGRNVNEAFRAVAGQMSVKLREQNGGKHPAPQCLTKKVATGGVWLCCWHVGATVHREPILDPKKTEKR